MTSDDTNSHEKVIYEQYITEDDAAGKYPFGDIERNNWFDL